MSDWGSGLFRILEKVRIPQRDLREVVKRGRSLRMKRYITGSIALLATTTLMVTIASIVGDGEPTRTPAPTGESQSTQFGLLESRPSKPFGDGLSNRSISAKPRAITSRTRDLLVSGSGCSRAAMSAIVVLERDRPSSAAHDAELEPIQVARAPVASNGRWRWTFELSKRLAPGRYAVWAACEREDMYEASTQLDIGVITSVGRTRACAEGPRLVAIPRAASVGARVTLEGSCFQREWNFGYGIFLIRDFERPECELIAAAEHRFRVRRDGSAVGYMIVPSEGDCFQRSSTRFVTPGRYRIGVGCHACQLAGFRVEP